uniref:Uncharacterized protein n=1 Tax=Cuerna arida TaxID=1464854 RepID=A0A1B6H497_9HEMI
MESLYFQIEPAFQKSFLNFGIYAIIICIILLVGVFAILWYNKKTIPVDPWEIPREKIGLVKELGKGNFGHKGHEKMNCAMSTVQKNTSDLELKSFLEDAEIMKCQTHQQKFEHPNKHNGEEKLYTN